jgi:hypothetical protein
MDTIKNSTRLNPKYFSLSKSDNNIELSIYLEKIIYAVTINKLS